MMRSRVASVAMLLFLLLLVSAVVYFNYLRPRILVLHSYSKEYVWTEEVNQGLERVLGDQSRIDVRYHYMKTKKFRNQDDLRRATIAALNVVRDLRPNVLIAVDDNAQKMVAKHFIDDPHIKIVFAGVNGDIAPYGYDKAHNVTGILERKPAAAIREMLLFLGELKLEKGHSGANGDTGNDAIAALAPSVLGIGGGTKTGSKVAAKDAPRALFLGDTSHSVKLDAEYLSNFDWSPVRYVGAEFVDTFAVWKKRVLSINTKTDFLLVGGYRKLKDEHGDGYADPVEVMEWTEANSPVPVLGMNVFNTAEGAMLSVGVSGYEQGETAARMALEILRQGRSPDSIKVKTSRQYVLSIRQSALDRRGIHLPKIFEAFSRVTNNYYQ